MVYFEWLMLVVYACLRILMRSSVGSKWGMRASMRRWMRVACEDSSRSEAEVAPEESNVSTDIDLQQTRK